MTQPTATLLLTRPRPQSERFAEECRRVLGRIRVEIAPILAIRARPDPVDLRGVAAVVLTSGNGARALASRVPVAGLAAWCVGDGTAEVARSLGMVASSAGGSADDLVAAIRRAAPGGLLLHVRGAESRGDVARRLTESGLPTREVILYDQVAQDPGDAARRLLQGAAPVVLPLFSPRAASLVGQAASAACAPLDLIALSPAVAGAWSGSPPRTLHICAQPDAAAMLDQIAALMRPDPP